MSFTSNTKSWKACNPAQERECKALTVFTVFKRIRRDVEDKVKIAKTRLLKKIEQYKEEKMIGKSLEKSKESLVALESSIQQIDSNPDGVAQLERIFAKVESHLELDAVAFFSVSEFKNLLRRGELSVLLRAEEKFKWSGSSNTLPRGKSVADIGISESLLNRLMEKGGASASLEGWLQAGDHIWRSLLQPEIDRRKNELRILKGKPDSPSVRQRIKDLESEIGKLEREGHL